MQSLSDIILIHFKTNINNVLTNGSANLSGPNEDLFMKLASRFSNWEVEAVYGGKTELRAQFKDLIYCALIKSLALPTPETVKGHFWSLYNVFECKHCRRLIPPEISHRVDCIANRYTIGLTGEVSSVHERAADWSLARQIARLKDDYRCDWKRIYWRLWSECHYLFCTTCESYYPVIDFSNCRHHSSEPVFSFIDEEGISTKMHPIGRFTCCEGKAYRYQTISHLKNTRGCKVTDHIPLLSNTVGMKSAYSVDIIKLLKMCKHHIARENEVEAADFKVGGDSNRDVNKSKKGIEMWHFISEEGNQVERDLCALKNLNLGLNVLDDMNDYSIRPISRKFSGSNWSDTNESSKIINNFSQFSNTEKTKIKIRSKVTLCSQKCFENDTLYSEGCCLPMQNINGEDKYFNRPIQYSKRTKRHKKTKCGLQSDQWVSHFSTRYNQDKQREYENNFFNRLNRALTKWAEDLKRDKIGSDGSAELDLNRDSSCEFRNEMNLLSSTMGYKGSRSDGSESEIESVKSASEDSLSSYCSTLNSSTRVIHSRTTSVWNSHVPLAGSYIRIETEFRDPCSSSKETAATGESIGIRNLASNINANTKARKQPTFTIQQHHHYNRRYSGKWLKNENMMVAKTKVLQVPMLKDKNSSEFYNSMWSFDRRSQELDYLSAMYIPLPITFNSKYYKYYKTIRNELANDWSDLVELEKSWNAFLCLFSENESLPDKNEHLAAADSKTDGFLRSRPTAFSYCHK